MQRTRARTVSGEAASDGSTSDVFPSLLQRRQRSLGPGADIARRELWRAFLRGALTEDELASTLDRLDSTGV
jgi:hypothetical protein